MIARLIAALVAVALFGVLVNAFLSVQGVRGNLLLYFHRHPPARRLVLPAPGSAGHRPPPAPAKLVRKRLLDRLERGQIVVALWAAGVAVLVGGLLARGLLAPVLRLTEAIRRYGRGDRGSRAVVRGHDQLAELAATFNSLADQIEREEQQKERMIADIAHELRTPLTVLRGELEAVRAGLRRLDAGTLDRLIGEVELLAHLVGDLRLLSSADSGTLVLLKRSCDLAGLVQGVVDSLTPRASAAGVTLSTRLEPGVVLADAERIRQVCYNLLDNALRYAPPGTAVEVSLELRAEVIFTVADRGPGIPEEDLSRVFDRLFRVDPARARGEGGSGLGLAIVRTLVEAHGGTVQALRRSGGGSVFRVKLPNTAPD